MAKMIPGVVSTTTSRLDSNKARIDRTLQDRILFFPITLRMVMDVTESPAKGSDFVQVSGEAKSYMGSWRLEETVDGTVFRFKSESEPDSVWPKPVIQYFIKNRLASSFEAMASVGMAYRTKSC